MKILHSYLFYSIKFAGGTSDLMFKLHKAQLKYNIDSYILTGNYNLDKNLVKLSNDSKVIVLNSFLDKYGFSIMPFLFIWGLINIHKFDLVHMHVYRTYQNIILFFLCKLFKVPYVMDAHGSVPLYTNKRYLKIIFDFVIGKKILNDAKFLIAETQTGVQEYMNLLPDYNKSKVIIISPPFDTDEFKALPIKGNFRKKWNIDPNLKVIMFLGRIHHIKGNDFLIKGFDIFIKKYTFNSKLVLVGSDDGHMKYCKDLVLQLGIENNVIFTGFIGGDDKNSALIDADIVVQLSRQEQGAWAPFEAVLCGTPIVVTSHTGSGEDVRKIDAGFLVDFDNNEQLAQLFNDILINYEQAKVKTNIAKNHIENYLSMNSRVKEYFDIYEKSIK